MNWKRYPFGQRLNVKVIRERENEWIRRRHLRATYQSLGALRDTTTYNKAECFHSLHDLVFKSLSSAIKKQFLENRC